MKVLHVSDLHYAGETLDEVERCLGHAVDFAREAKPGLVVISGDATDHRLDVHSPAVIALAQRVRQFSDLCPVLMLQGTFSHEPPGTLDVMGLVGGRHPVFVADRICQVAVHVDQWHVSAGWRFEPDEVTPNRMQAIISCIPSVNKGAVAAAVGAAQAAEAVGEQIAILLAGFAESNERARALGIPTLGVSHGTVSGCVTEHGVPMAGLDHEFTTGSLFAARCSAFLLGHIHKHQHWERAGRRIAYPGSIGRLHYGELDPKGFLLWDVSAAGAEFQFQETPARRMVHVDFPGLPDLEHLAEVAASAEGAFVRVRWNVDEEHVSAVDRTAIEALFGDAAQVKLEGRVLPIVRSRAEGMNRAISPGEKLAKWCEATGTASEGLAERLSAVMASDPEAIAARILAQPAATPAGASA